MQPKQLQLPFMKDMNPYTIYLDMDGVIVNMADILAIETKKILSTQNKYSKKFFNKHTLDINQITPSYLKDLFIKKDLGFELSRKEKDLRNLTYKPLSNNRGLWATLPPYKGAKNFVSFLLENFKVNILSSPVDDECIKGKQDWIQTNFPLVFERCIFETEKYIHAEANGILIDDRPKNVRLWREAGGIAIQHIDFETTLEELQQYL